MNIGVLKETRTDELRVALTPYGVAALSARGHNVFVESGCGTTANAPDQTYQEAGATIMEHARDVSENVDILTKIAPPSQDEFNVYREVQTLFSFISVNSERPLIEMLLKKRITSIALNSIRTDQGRFPMIESMSVIAGQQAVMHGWEQLKSSNNGSGTSLIRVPGLQPATVAVLGADATGEAAARTAASLGSTVYLIERSRNRIRRLAHSFPANLIILQADLPETLEAIQKADLVIDSTGIATENLSLETANKILSSVKRGTVYMDASGTPGNETIAPSDSIPASALEEAGIVYCANLNPTSAVAATASRALENAHLPWLLELADQGVIRALKSNAALRRGLMSFNGTLCRPETWEDQERPWKSPEEALGLTGK